VSALESWIFILSFVGGVSWITFQAYRLAKWNESVTNSLPEND
jgi:hypothetical protein